MRVSLNARNIFKAILFCLSLNFVFRTIIKSEVKSADVVILREPTTVLAVWKTSEKLHKTQRPHYPVFVCDRP
jgi:hypothetical protein